MNVRVISMRQCCTRRGIWARKEVFNPFAQPHCMANNYNCSIARRNNLFYVSARWRAANYDPNIDENNTYRCIHLYCTSAKTNNATECNIVGQCVGEIMRKTFKRYLEILLRIVTLNSHVLSVLRGMNMMTRRYLFFFSYFMRIPSETTWENDRNTVCGRVSAVAADCCGHRMTFVRFTALRVQSYIQTGRTRNERWRIGAWPFTTFPSVRWENRGKKKKKTIKAVSMNRNTRREESGKPVKGCCHSRQPP
jgi:hypothetical protein